uniref:uncharacterized protein n=1 Tax=Pristiophorus japonicus TaxID=55135 RepID=UPI00398E8249
MSGVPNSANTLHKETLRSELEEISPSEPDLQSRSERYPTLKAHSNDVEARKNYIVTGGELNSALCNLYTQDEMGAFKEGAQQTEFIFLENGRLANSAIAHMTKRLHTMALESRSSINRQSGHSTKSSRTSSSSQTTLINAQANAAATAKNTDFEVIARQPAESKAAEGKAKTDLQRLQADSKAAGAKAEADLQILQAKKIATIQQARVEEMQ